MLRALLDTHSFLWFVTADKKLSTTAEGLISVGENELLLSVASVWEIAIKVNTGRLPIPEPLDTFIPGQLEKNRIALLPIALAHVVEAARLPLHHRDPFDRLLICQAIVESLPILSADSVFDDYPVRRIW
jgi:PIN domain nuclease of toxin-antitoxin system